MGHKRKKNIQPQAPQNPPQPINLDAIGKIMENIDVSAMANMLNSIDINQIMSLLSNNNPIPNINLNPLDNRGEEQQNIAAGNPLPIPSTQAPIIPELPQNDPTFVILNSLKPFLPEDKCKIIDDMIKLLGIKSVIDSIFPPKTT